ncbi:MAG: hypothetical protein ABEJ28_08995 [Salinigranum sp.]
MSETTIETIRGMVESALAETDDSEVAFKLRTALQLLMAVEEQYLETRDVLTEAEIEDDLRATLRELGYLE